MKKMLVCFTLLMLSMIIFSQRPLPQDDPSAPPMLPSPTPTPTPCPAVPINNMFCIQ